MWMLSKVITSKVSSFISVSVKVMLAYRIIGPSVSASEAKIEERISAVIRPQNAKVLLSN